MTFIGEKLQVWRKINGLEKNYTWRKSESLGSTLAEKTVLFSVFQISTFFLSFFLLLDFNSI